MLVGAVATLAAAAVMAVVADAGLPPWFHGWRFPVLVIGLAAANVGPRLTLIFEPDAGAGPILLASALLLVFASHRRVRTSRVARRSCQRGPER